MRTSHRGRRQRATAQSLRKINLSVSLSLHPRLPLPPSCSLAHSPVALSDLLWVFLHNRDRVELPSDLGSRAPRSLPLGSHLHYEREDLLAAEYNADLSVSIHRDREPSSSRVPLRRGYTYPPSAARRGTEKTKREGRNRGEEKRDRTLGVFCAWPSRFCASATRAREVAKQMAATDLKTRAEVLRRLTSMISISVK